MLLEIQLTEQLKIGNDFNKFCGKKNERRVYEDIYVVIKEQNLLLVLLELNFLPSRKL